MPNPGTEVVVSRVFDRALQLAQSGDDPRAYSNRTHTGLRVDTTEFGKVDVALRHDPGGTPEEFIVCGASISVTEDAPYGRQDLDGTVTSDTVSYRLDNESTGTELAPVKSAPLQKVMAAVSKAL